MGLESTPQEYVEKIVGIFREVRRVLRDDGVLFLNLGDSYTQKGCGPRDPERWPKQSRNDHMPPRTTRQKGIRAKNRLGIPHRVVFALQDDGWVWRDEIVWEKCLSGGSWVYAKTQKGEMPIMVKDLVRLNPKTVQLWDGGKWTQVVDWSRSADSGNKLELVLRSGERIGCTGTHRWPTQRGNVRADELMVGDVIQTCNLPEPPNPGRPEHLADDALWFVGLYLAEGSRSGDKIQIAGHADESNWFGRIESVAKHYGGSATKTVSGNKLCIRVYGRLLVALLETYIGGVDAESKHLKVAAWSLPNASLREIVNGYLDGDGHKDRDNPRYRLGFCRNYSLERDLRTLAARLSATLTLKPCVASSQWGKFPAFKGEWRWDRTGHWNEKDRGEIVKIRASRARHCWDISVADEPHLFALASGVLTHNSNPMPESVNDRTTKAHEFVFLLTKSAKYFYDAEAIKEPAVTSRKDILRAKITGRGKQPCGTAVLGSPNRDRSGGFPQADPDNPTRNARSVWEITSQAYKGAHFACMPPKLAARLIQAGSSEHGACPACGAPYRRQVSKTRLYRERPNSLTKRTGEDGTGNYCPNDVAGVKAETIGWKPSCKCDSGVVPSTVFDPFGGSGTTVAEANRLGRSGIMMDLNADYLKLAEDRIRKARIKAGLDVDAGKYPIIAEIERRNAS